jgi:hypothetical protein
MIFQLSFSANLLLNFAHIISGHLFTFFALAYGAEYLMSLYLLNSKPTSEQKKNETNTRLHPAYTNLEIYRTVFPMLTSFAILLISVFWFMMAFKLFLIIDLEHANDDHMATMTVGGMLFSSITLTVLGMAVSSSLLHYFDRTNEHN